MVAAELCVGGQPALSEPYLWAKACGITPALLNLLPGSCGCLTSAIIRARGWPGLSMEYRFADRIRGGYVGYGSRVKYGPYLKQAFRV